MALYERRRRDAMSPFDADATRRDIFRDARVTMPAAEIF
jgi:hypothetical protein